MKIRMFSFCLLLFSLNAVAVSVPPIGFLFFNRTNGSVDSVMRSQLTTNCEFNILLDSPEQNSVFLYEASNSITTQENYFINTGDERNITMKAGKVIVLKKGTRILKGNRYLARIEPCETVCYSANEVEIPRGISPNGDSKNDQFDLSFLCSHSLTIFNRYGEIVYKEDNYSDQWHGQSDKGDLPTATYYYVISFAKGGRLSGWVYLQK
ncbi:gliding motility-associated C-terminal domain-containing protein [Flavobacterium alkalisoli]|uniref:Gliding motility-associated C-terminal domain-containing protein n=1 Tax=Flavobacterium alkalisoli TaxID=2602769 RepID=A0A5B9FT34_9FLAO|nr:gliding motility-associated C-terminal domain-containing protein [Flavobacterium alkalisoli]QEE49349.1 gliding motility-associated C-terminal domain-containing protein [Flavobacterium alkalisoli]